MLGEMLIADALLALHVLSVVSASAPGDADEFCLNITQAVGSNKAILMDSYNYILLLANEGDVNNTDVLPAWQAVDLDVNNGGGVGTRVSLVPYLQISSLQYLLLYAVGSAF